MTSYNYIRTGVFASKEEIADMREKWKIALNTPVIIVCGDCPDMATSARKNVTDQINELAKKHGCKNQEMFGMDLDSGEFFYEKP